MKTSQHFSRLQITLHWLIALLIGAAWVFDDGMGRALRARLQADALVPADFPLHVWIGSTVFALVLIRIVVRFVQGVPDQVSSNALMRQAAVWGHRLLLVLMVIVPAFGAGAWYGGVEAAGEPHELLANLLLIVALGHAAVALWHQYVMRDGTLARMTRPRA